MTRSSKKTAKKKVFQLMMGNGDDPAILKEGIRVNLLQGVSVQGT